MFKICLCRLTAAAAATKTYFGKVVSKSRNREARILTEVGQFTYRHDDSRVTLYGSLDHVRDNHPVKVVVKEAGERPELLSITVQSLRVVYPTLHQGAKAYEAQAVDCFGNVSGVLSVDLDALAVNSATLEPRCEVRTTADMGTSLQRVMKTEALTHLKLRENEVGKADGWGSRVYNAEADIVLMADKADGWLASDEIAQGLGQLLHNAGGALYTLTKGLDKVVYERIKVDPGDDGDGKGRFAEVAAAFQGIRLLVGEVTVPQQQAPYKLLQLQRDLDVLGHTNVVGMSDAKGVLEACDDANTAVLIWFNGSSATLETTMRELSTLLHKSTTLSVTNKRVYVVYCPYMSLVATMATARQFRLFLKEFASLALRVGKLEGRFGQLEEKFVKFETNIVQRIERLEQSTQQLEQSTQRLEQSTQRLEQFTQRLEQRFNVFAVIVTVTLAANTYILFTIMRRV